MKIFNPFSSLVCKVFKETTRLSNDADQNDSNTNENDKDGQDLLDKREKEEEKNAGDNGASASESASGKQWDNPVEFLLSCISMSVGLGNVWRFPYTAYANGGGAFLIPYLLVLLLIGRPFYLLELGLGQFSSSGCVGVWDLAPAARGIGYAQGFATAAVVSYYTVLIAIAFRFMFASFATTLPWTLCDGDGSNSSDYLNNAVVCLPSGQNISELNLPENVSVMASTEQYFKKTVLKEVTNISGGVGLPDPALAGCLLLAWVIIFLALRKGVSSSGKVAYFTAIFPYTVMLMLLVKGLTLPGAMKGIVFFFKPEWKKLLEVRVWYAAVTQSFYSLSIGFGTLSTFSSFNRFRHNIYRDASIISLADTMTSVLAGVITFSVLGHLATELGTPIEEVVKSGTGLAFISYPEVIAKFGFAPQFFAVIFFLMLITLGLGSVIGLTTSTVAVLRSVFPALGSTVAAAIISLLSLLVGLVYTTPGGQAVLELVDYYGGSLLILVVAVAEIIILAWIYKTSRLIDDFSFMLELELGLYWKLCWSFVIPVSLSLILGYTLIFYAPVSYAGAVLPVTAQAVGWIVTSTGVAMVVVVFLSSMISTRKGLSPLPSWGPKNPVNRMDWMYKDVGTSLSIINNEAKERIRS